MPIRSLLMFAVTATGVILGEGSIAMGYEEGTYEVVRKQSSFELRDYGPQILAETSGSGDGKSGQNPAFMRLFRYISGANVTSESVAMTVPVVVGEQSTSPTAAASEKIAMTVPVVQSRGEGELRMTFMVPSHYTMETVPKPTDERVRLVQQPARRVATVRYSGPTGPDLYQRHVRKLEDWLTSESLTATGPPVQAIYNGPYTPSFLRRNEVHIPVSK